MKDQCLHYIEKKVHRSVQQVNKLVFLGWEHCSLAYTLSFYISTILQEQKPEIRQKFKIMLRTCQETGFNMPMDWFLYDRALRHERVNGLWKKNAEKCYNSKIADCTLFTEK